MADRNHLQREIDLIPLKLIKDYLFATGLLMYGIFLFIIIAVFAYGHFQTNWQNIVNSIVGFGFIVGGIWLVHISGLLKKKIENLKD